MVVTALATSGKVRPGACLVATPRGLIFVQDVPSVPSLRGRGWLITSADPFGEFADYGNRVRAGDVNAYVEAPVSGLEEPTPFDGLILGIESRSVPLGDAD